MRIVELLLFALFLIGFGFKWMHWPGSGVLLLISLSSLAIIGLIESIRWKTADSGLEKPPVLSRVFLGISLFTACSGLLFKLLHWSAATVLLTTGAILLVFGVVLVLQKVNRGSRMYIRLIAYVLIVGFFRVVSDEQLLRWKFPDDPEYVRRMTEYYENPGNDSLRNNAYNYWYEKDPEHYGKYDPKH